MDFWNTWADLLQEMLRTLAFHWGLGAGLAIIILTVAVRAALLPLTWTLAYRSALHQSRLAKLKPALEAIRDRHAEDRRAQMEKTLELYRQHGLTVADGKGLLGALAQMPVIYGLYKGLSNGVGTTAFLWIRNLGRPDALLAILAALTTAAMIGVAPNLPGSIRLALVLLPAMLCFIAALHFSSGMTLYWITSNLFGTVQTLALRRTLKYRGIH
jgi:YidC/Oxa1 family membrane protein insertase